MKRKWLWGWVLCVVLAGVAGLAPAEPVHKAPTLSVNPAEGLVSSGNEGGPFAPATRQYSVSNSGDGTLSWSVSANQPWVTVTTAPAGQGTQLVVGSAAATSGTVEIPLSLLRGTGTDPARGPSSITATIVYNSDVLDFQSSTENALLDTWYGKELEASESFAGRIRLVVFGVDNDPTGHPREITTFDNERAGGDPQAQQNPFPLGTLRFSVVGASGASTALTVEDLVMVDGSIPTPLYLEDVSGRNGLFTVSSTPPPMTSDGTATVTINSNAATLQGSAEGMTYTATVDFSSNGGSATRTVTLTVVESCVAPPAPTSVQATDGTYPDRVRVTWSGSTSATQYQVYRSETDDSSTAQPLSPWIADASYDDLSAAAPAGGGGGCGSAPTNRYYFYWVKARNDCGTSAFSGGDRGHRAATRKAALRGSVLEEALPAGSSALPDAKLFLCLRSDEPIAARSVWGTVESMAEGTAVGWIPVDADGRDGWVAFAPVEAWMPGDVVSLRAGARTVSGTEVGPVQRQFRIESAGSEPRETVAWQPAAGADYDAAGLAADSIGQASVMALTDAAVPPFAEAVGAPYRIGPSGVFDSAQRVWLPVPAGENPERLVVYYYHADGSNAGWYPADKVDGWLVPSSERLLDLDRGTYLGFEVRHGAIVQLGTVAAQPPSQASVVPLASSLGGALGDAAVFLVVALVLAGLGRRQTAK